MKILVLGGDGYLGWPTAMHLSNRGHEVTVVDNYFRREAINTLGLHPLFDVQQMSVRAKLWSGETEQYIKSVEGDIKDYKFLLTLCRETVPEVIVHYAEQPSAPYSMMNYDCAKFTLENNLIGTLNVAHAVKETDLSTHIVKLGTMGEYGTPNIDIEEGFIDIEHKGRKDTFLFPRQASSLYHTSKIHDTDLLYFYVRTWGLKVTDLMQGPVYGLFTKEMNNNEQLRTFFNYDSIFGTVINRFVVQAAMGIPLTLYGSGNQNRGYINLLDTMECVALTAENPPSSGELRIFNQFTQTLSVRQIAEKVTRAAKGLGIDVTTTCIENPRTEADEHYYNPVTKGLHELGLVPVLLDEKILVEMLTVVLEHKRYVNTEIIHSKVNWR